jgi:flagella synthesis protein FlgN
MNHLISVLEKQCHHVEQLYELANNVRLALLSRDPEALVALITHKEQLLRTIQNLDLKLKELGLAEHKEAQNVQVWVHKIQDTLINCQRLNDNNQAMIETSMASLNRLKKILIQSRHQDTLTYTGKGQPHTTASAGESIEA